MTNDISLILSTFEKLRNTRFDRTMYNHRLVAQKLAYIMKWLGYSINYSFSWYLRGPYSHDIGHDIFTHYDTKADVDITKIKEFLQNDIEFIHWKCV